jgi:hypothetical protein
MRSRVLVATFALVLLPAAVASAAPGWVTPTAELTPLKTEAPNEATVLADRDGNVLVAWQDNNASLWTSERLAGGTFSEGKLLLSNISSRVTMGVDGQGVVHAFMLRDPGGGTPEVEELLHRIGSADLWTGSTILAAGADVERLEGTVNPAGDAFVVFNDNGAPKWAERTAGAAWTTPAPLSTGTDPPTKYELAMDVAGDVAVGYQRPEAFSTRAAPYAVYKAAGAPPSSPEQLDADLINDETPSIQGPYLGIDDSGTATAVFTHGPDPPTTNTATVEFATRARDAVSWTKAQSPEADLSSTTVGPPGNLAIEVLANGETFAFWAQSSRIHVRRRAPTATAFEPESLIPSNGENDGSELVVAAPDGTVTVVFDTTVGAGLNQVLRAARREPGGSFTALPDIPAPVRSVIRGAAVDPFGDVPIAWLFISPDPKYQVVATALDAAAPAIDTATFGDSGEIGTPIPFAAHATDLWSPAIGYFWDFGDGTTSTDASGSKTFAVGGILQPQLTVSDGFGNATTRGFTTTIPAAPVPGQLVVSGLTITPSAFRAAAKGGSVAKAIGATVRYIESAAATATLTVQRPARGVRKGTRCVKRPRHPRRGAKRCTRYLKEGSFTHTAEPGPVSLRFTGRVRKHKLRIGRHRLSIVARNAGGKSKPLRKGFRIIRR